ncbi:MAG: hypothetical protein J6U43_00780 [Bacteroidales bacterium]|nr:hypothetical protein [Bacteroidales bacterium]
MNKAKLIADVRHCLDEQGLLTDIAMSLEDSLPIDQRIEALACSSFNTLQHILPLKYLTPIPLPLDGMTKDIQQGTGLVPVPADFLRLYIFRMEGWKKAVTSTISEDSPEYLYQLCPATRGGSNYPVVAIVDGGRYLKYFSMPKGRERHAVERAAYVKVAADIEQAWFEKEAYGLFVWWLAKDVAASFQRNTQQIESIIKTMLDSYGNQL